MKYRKNEEFGLQAVALQASRRCLRLVVIATTCAVLTSISASAQTSRKAGGIVGPVYREPVYAPRRARALVQSKSNATRSAAPIRAKATVPAASKPGVAVTASGAGAAAAVAGADSSPIAPEPEAGATTADPMVAHDAPAIEAAPVDKRATAAVTVVPMTIEQFLDRLMIAESGGRLDAKNPRSTALGPFQFIESTFLAVAKRNFATETANLSNEQILALRTDMAFARKAAEAYSRENAAVLKSYDVEPTYPNLRLAFLLGPAGAAKVLKAPPLALLQTLLSPAVLIANPFMVSMTASGLAARSAREVWQPINSTQGVTVPPGTVLPRRVAAGPVVSVQCNIRLPSCKRWVALETAKLRGKAAPSTKIANAARQTGQEMSGALSRLSGPKGAAMPAAAGRR